MKNKNVLESLRDRVWPLVAICALLLCAWMALSRCGTPALADNGGATSNGLIALVGVNPGVEHLYLIDTNSSDKTITVYESRGGNNLQMVAGRSFANDSFFLSEQPGRFLKYNSDGYDEKIALSVTNLKNKRKP